MMAHRILIFAGLVLLVAATVTGQPPDRPSSFEVASVKAIDGRGRNHVDPPPIGVTIEGSFSYIVAWAFGIKKYQCVGPGWAETGRYFVQAKGSGPVAVNELRSKLQTLLAERFMLDSHRETKELGVYALVVAKGGLKLKASDTEGESVTTNNARKPGAGGMSVRTSMAQLADLLDGSCPDPVVDRTGLTGRYDFNLDLAPYMIDRQHLDIPAILAEALPKQLGIGLEHRKITIEMLVIDRAEKVPVEN